MTDRHSRSGVPLEPTYTPGHVGGLDYEENLNAPGSYPFTRGQRAGAGRGWIHRELSGEGDPRESNRQLKSLIDQGQMGIDVIGDSPTMAWLDPDHPLAVHSVGTQGVSLCCLQDYRGLYEGLPLGSITVSASLPPPLAVAGLYLTAQENDFPTAQLRGSVLQWPFYAEDCGYATHMPMPMPLRLRLTLDCIEFCTREMPKFHGFLEDTYFFSEAGLNAVEEMALGLVLAGVHAIEISAFDEAYRTPSAESHLVGLRTQQVIHLETGVANVADPLGGSYYIESLTNEIEKRTRSMVLDIESRGDPADLAEKGWFRKFFQSAMTRYARQLAEGQVQKVGLNCLEIPEEKDTLLRDVEEEKIEPYRERIDRIKAYKDSRNAGEIKEVLRRLRQEAGTRGRDLMPPILQAWKAGATMGEIGGMLRMAYDFPYDPLGFLDPPV